MGVLSGIPLAEDVEKKVTDLAVAAMFRGLKYMFCYKSYVKDFNTKIEDLNNCKDRMKIDVDRERNNGKQIHADVLKWQKDVEEIQKKDNDLSPSFKCFHCLPIPNPVSRLRLGRQAVQKSKAATGLTDSGMKLFEKEIAYLQQSEDVPINITVFQEFPSRKEAFEKLWEQLESEESLILGIHGMPGVGKTRMMEEIWQKAQGQEKKIFDKVILAVVGSVTFDVIKLQDQLASGLECNLVSKDDRKSRAHQLKNSMLSYGKILVIFDDVWGEISVTDIIGTSFNVASSTSVPERLDDGNSWKGCKILFTSREKSHCVNNKCKEPVEITTLKDKEALDMFKNTLGTDQTDSPPDESLVQQVCTKCAGLPLIIHAVGKALKFKTFNLWKDALTQLEDCKIESVEGIDPKVYACLKLSFDNLPKDAKQCLFLCSLIEAGKFFDIDTLTVITAGSQLVHDGRVKASAMVDTLRSASLLLKHEAAETFRLHDIIRDVARSIAIKDHGYFIERCGRGLPGNSADYGTGKVMHLQLEKDDFNFPPDLVCPDLHTIWLVTTYRTKDEQPCEISIPILPGGTFLNLSLLVLERFVWKQQLYLQPLRKLKTLMVLACNIADTDVTCFPESLETLCIRNCDLPTHLDFSKLINLQRLEIDGNNLSQMVPNTISSLSCLKKLHLHHPSCDDSSLALMPKFSEISKLTCLTDLRIFWSDFEPSEDTSIFRKLVRYDIRVGVLPKGYRPRPDVSTTRRIELCGKLKFEGFQNLVERADEVILRNTDVNIGRIWNSNIEAFKDLRKLRIEDCDTIEYLARISLYEIQPILPQGPSFFNLTILAITRCRAMKYLFNNIVAKCLVQLEGLSIENCEGMEVIVMNEGKSDGDFVNFSKLIVLDLLSLSNLKSFYGEKKDMHSSSTSIMDDIVVQPQPQPLFDGMVAFPSLEGLKISGLNDTVSRIWGKYYNNDNDSSFWKLKRLDVSSCSGLKNVFQHSPMASHLIMHLEKMNVSSCKTMVEIIGTGELKELSNDRIIVFPELTKLEVVDLPNLSSFCCKSGRANTYKVKFPSLMELTLEDVEINLEVIELGRDDSTRQLERLNLSCNKEMQLPSSWKPTLFDLERLTLRNCLSDVLKSLCFFRKLKLLKVTELKWCTLFSLSVLMSLQQLEVLDISNCSLLEEILEDASVDEVCGIDKKTLTLFNLKTVLLENLPNLKSFIRCTHYELHMPALERVAIFSCGLPTLFTCSLLQELKQLEVLLVLDCKLLVGIVADTRGIETSDSNDKIITLPQLSSVTFSELPNLKSFIQGDDYELNMPALKTVRVGACGLLSTLFTCSSFQKLQQLEELLVRDCKLLESIVEDERGIETSNTCRKIMTFSQLNVVGLKNLPNLKSFSLAVSCAFKMPELQRFDLYECPLIETFTFLKTSTGLVNVNSDWHKGQDVSDLNDYIRQQCRRHQPLKVSFFSSSWSCPWAC